MLDLNPINERLNKATPGPWEVGQGAYFDLIDTVGVPHRGIIAVVDDEDCDVHGQAAANRDLIANAPTDLRACVAEIERLRAENALANAAAQASYDWFYGDSTTEQEQAMCDAWFIWRRSLISD